MPEPVAHTGLQLRSLIRPTGELELSLLSVPTAPPAATEYSRYGSTTLKQVYIYGGLDTGPTEFVRNFGFAWSMGGWLLFPYLQRIGAPTA